MYLLVATFSASSCSKWINLHTNFICPNMGIVFLPSKMLTKLSFRRKLVTFIKMSKITDRKDRNEQTLLITGNQFSHGDKTAGQRYLGSFVLQLFCSVLILSLVSALLFWLFRQRCFYSGTRFVLLLRVFEECFSFTFQLYRPHFDDLTETINSSSSESLGKTYHNLSLAWPLRDTPAVKNYQALQRREKPGV